MITRSDDTNAFGQEELLRINFSVPEGQVVSKAIVKLNDDLALTYDYPESPIRVGLNSQQTQMLKDNSSVDIILFDGNNLQQTFHCVAEFKSKERAL